MKAHIVGGGFGGLAAAEAPAVDRSDPPTKGTRRRHFGARHSRLHSGRGGRRQPKCPNVAGDPLLRNPTSPTGRQLKSGGESPFGVGATRLARKRNESRVDSARHDNCDRRSPFYGATEAAAKVCSGKVKRRPCASLTGFDTSVTLAGPLFPNGMKLARFT
jgi:hypothetical protein